MIKLKPSPLNYDELLDLKKIKIVHTGFDIIESQLNPLLFDFQKYCTRLAIRAGRFALFEDCGLGKTFQGCEWLSKVTTHTEKPGLCLAPLAVVDQTIIEAERFGYIFNYQSRNSNNKLQITNYEQLDNVNPDDYSSIWLDESSILKNLTGAIRNKIIKGFEQTPFKLCTTATPSPNDPMELGNHSEFLNVLSYNEMLAMYFTHDGSDTSKWKLKGHAKDRFYEWVNTWAIMLSNPADIGFSAKGYDLSKLNFIEKQIKTEQRNNGQLYNGVAVSATNINAEFKLTLVKRLDEVQSIVNQSDENFVIWIKQIDEGVELKKLLPSAIEVKGSDTPEYKKAKLLGFAKDEFKILITKTKIASFGLNYQNCHNTVFAALDFGFEAVYQGIRRFLRFGQKYDVNAYLITTDTMQNVIASINKKIKSHIEMQKGMTKAHLKTMETEKGIIKSSKREVYKGQNFEVERGDCVKLIKNIKNDSVGFSMFSPPFPELYVYSSENEDMGNNKNWEDFIPAFEFMVSDLYYKMQAGRNVAVHCQDLPIQKGKEGFIGLRDFSGMILDSFCGKSKALQTELQYLQNLINFIYHSKEPIPAIIIQKTKEIEERILQTGDFIYHSKVTLWKNPVIEMTRTHALGLLHAQIKKDAGMSRVGLPDYLMVFRKPGEHLNPVIHQDKDTNGPNFMNVDMWQKIASPVWMDIDFGNTLNARGSKDHEDEKHICPLSLDTIERATLLWSNPGDTCYTPFGGIGSEPFKWLQMGRKSIAHELKQTYFNVNVKNCKNAEIGKSQHLLFS